jgi:hypothetical protein
MSGLLWLVLSSPPGGTVPEPKVEPIVVPMSNVVPMPSMNVPPREAPASVPPVATTPAEVARRVEAALLTGDMAPLAAHLPDHEIRHVEAHPGRELPLIMKLPADRLVGVIERLRSSGKTLNGFEDMQCEEASAAEKGSESGGLPRLSAAEAGPVGSLALLRNRSQASAAEKGSESGGLPRLSAAEAGPVGSLALLRNRSQACCKSMRPATAAGTISLEEVCTEPTADGRRVITLFGVRFG